MSEKIVLIDGIKYKEYEIKTQNQTAKIYEYIQTNEEIAEQQKQSRISELKALITNKKLLDMDCTAERNELRGLLGL